MVMPACKASEGLKCRGSGGKSHAPNTSCAAFVERSGSSSPSERDFRKIAGGQANVR